MIDKDEYPRTAELERRCVRILANLWNSPDKEAPGCSTIGSSEACMLAGLAMKRRCGHGQHEGGILKFDLFLYEHISSCAYNIHRYRYC